MDASNNSDYNNIHTITTRADNNNANNNSNAHNINHDNKDTAHLQKSIAKANPL